MNGRTYTSVITRPASRRVNTTSCRTARSIIEKTRWGVAEGNHGTVALPDPAESPVFFPPGMFTAHSMNAVAFSLAPPTVPRSTRVGRVVEGAWYNLCGIGDQSVTVTPLGAWENHPSDPTFTAPTIRPRPAAMVYPRSRGRRQVILSSPVNQEHETRGSISAFRERYSTPPTIRV